MPFPGLCCVVPSDATHPDPAPDPPPPKPPAAPRGPFAALRRFLRRNLPLVPEEDPDEFLPFSDTPGTSADAKAPLPFGPRLFSYSELYIGSSGFSEAELLGSGGFGRVYRAVLPSDGTVVAVKNVAGGGGEADRLERSFAAELAAVARLRHRNLVRLRGWCVHEQQLLLVYDYMPNRSLDRLLFGGGAASQLLGWKRRLGIVAGLAAALHYLHEQLDTQIIHRDVKASNVMLDSAYDARLGDFGLARWLEHEASAAPTSSPAPTGSARCVDRHFRLTNTSRIGGTIGYLPPETFTGKGTVTAKSDVFSFGVVALEVATGQRAIDLARPDEHMILLDWMRELADEGDYSPAADRRLPPSDSDLRRLVHVGLLCSLHDPSSRPTMKWVVEVLSDGCRDLPPLPTFKSQPNYYISFSSSKTTISTSGFSSSANTTVAHSPTPTPRLSTAAFAPVDAPREITLREIAAITGNFSRRIAELDYGTGYCGYLEDPGMYVLVKRLATGTCAALRARFSAEMRNVAKLRHRHLVQLHGWCKEKGEMLVVYECSMCNVLARRLFRRRGPAMSWRRRHSIVRSLASAVLYLHEEWDEQVIHRNITSSAVFLDRDSNPRLGCFALAEFLARGEHGLQPAAARRSERGMFGYVAPECLETGEASTKADVYSFGVVVLEVVTGERAVDARFPEVLLARRVRSALWRRRTPEEMADRRLEGDFDGEELARLVLVGVVCTHSKPESRPSMREIVSILDGNEELLKTYSSKKEGREEWEEWNAQTLSLARRIQAIGIH